MPVGIASLNSADAVPDDDEWQRHRAALRDLLKPALTNQYVKRVYSTALDFQSALDRSLSATSDQTLDLSQIRHITTRYGLEAIAVVMMGKKLGALALHPSKDLESFILAAKDMFSLSEELLFRSLPLWKVMETATLKQLYKSWDDLFHFAELTLNNRTHGMKGSSCL